MQRPFWLGLFLMLSLCCRGQLLSAQDDPLFGDESTEDAADDLFGGDDPADKDADDQPATEEADTDGDDADLFGDGEAMEEDAATDDDAAEATDAAIDEDEAMEDEDAGGDEPDDLFGGTNTDDGAGGKTTEPKAALHARPQAEVKAELVKLNDAIGQQFTTFVERNKELAKAAVQNGDAAELMPILREYGPAVIATKQAWLTLIGNPAKYDTWIGSPQYDAAWRTFSSRWQALQQYPKRFAVADLALADKLTDELAKLGDSFQEYSDVSDEWDGKIGDQTRQFSFADDDEAAGNVEDEEIDFGADAKMPDDDAFDFDEAEDQAIERDEMEEDAEEAIPADKGAEATLDQDDGAAEEDAFDFGADDSEEMPDETAEKTEAGESDGDDDLFGDADDADSPKDASDGEKGSEDEKESEDDLFGE